MLELYWGLLITGVLFALVTVVFGDLMSGAMDGMLDWLSSDVLHYLQPMVLFSGVTVLGGAGILLTKYSPFTAAAVLVLSLHSLGPESAPSPPRSFQPCPAWRKPMSSRYFPSA